MEPEEAREGRARPADGALDWPAVRAALEPLTSSGLGKRALLELTARPDAEARAALERARELQALGERGQEPPLAGVPDPEPVLANAARYGRALDGPDLALVLGLLRVAEDLGHWLAGRRAELGACAALWAGSPDVSGLRERLEGALDARGRIVDQASPLLARLRHAIGALEAELDGLMRTILGSKGVRAALASGHASQVHRRGGRRVLAVRQRHQGQVPGIVHDRSQSGETLFVEPRDAVELGNRLATAEADETREVARILAELTREVLTRREDVARLTHSVGELELALVSARYARATGGRTARLPGEPGAARGLLLRGWRHPLLLVEAERGRLDSVVPIDIRLGDDFQLLVVTGPNTGGKTLALKSAGLAALMTRMGLALPCDEGTTVPLYDGIACDIGDEQEIQQNLSTFSSHLVRIQAGLERAGENTLVLLDELGGGTDPSEGAALGEAILETLLVRGAPTIATTHLGQLKEFGFRHDRAENAHVEFDLESLAPLYTVVIGAPGESRALAIARRLGVPAELVDLAESRLVRRGDEVEEIMHEMKGVRVDAERLRSEAERRLVALEADRAEFDLERARMGEKEEQLEAEAQRGIEERMLRAKDWLAKGRALLERLDKGARAEVETLLDGLEAAVEGAALSDRRREFLEGLKKGSLVWVPRFKKRCTVARVRREKREVTVKVGRHEMVVGFDDVTFYEQL